MISIMKLISTVVTVTGAFATTVSYDRGYDNATRSLDLVSCSDGEHGLETVEGWKTQGEIPGFPYIGGAEAVSGWDSPNCGTCWSATYKNRTIYITAIDRAAEGLNIALEAMNILTDDQAVTLGRIDAEVAQADVSHCASPR